MVQSRTNLKEGKCGRKVKCMFDSFYLFNFFVGVWLCGRWLNSEVVEFFCVNEKLALLYPISTICFG